MDVTKLPAPTEASSAKKAQVIDARGISVDEVNNLLPPVPGAKTQEKPPEWLTPAQVEDNFNAVDDHKAKAATPKKSETTVGQHMMIDLDNTYRAAAQGVTPILAAHAKNYLGEAEERDDGRYMYKNEKGELVETNNKEHVMLRDPTDQKYKIYKRTKDVEVPKAVSIGHAISPGMVVGAPPINRAATAGSNILNATKRLEEATDVKVPIGRAAASDSEGIHRAARMSSHLPGGAGAFEQSAQATAGRLGQAADRVAEIPLGGVAKDAEGAGNAAREGITRTAEKGGILSQKVDAAYAKVDALMPTSVTPLPVPETTKTAQKLQTAFESTKKEGIDPAVKEVLGAVTDPKGLTYEGIKNLRTMVGEKIDPRVVGGDVSQGALKQLYGALTKDLREVILQRRPDGSIPPDAIPRLKAWERANKTASAAADRREKLATLLGADTKSDEAIFHSILRAAQDKSSANAKLLNLARRSMAPDEWSSVTSAVIGRMGRRVTAEGQHFDPAVFIRDYGHIPERSKDVLFGAKGSTLRQSLDDIERISNKWPTVRDMSHRTSELGHLVGAAGVWHKPLEFLTGVALIKNVSGWLARPATARSVAKWSERYRNFTLRPDEKATRRVLLEATQELAKEVGKDPETAAKARQEMEAAGKTAITGAAIIAHLAKRIYGGIERE